MKVVGVIADRGARVAVQVGVVAAESRRSAATSSRSLGEERRSLASVTVEGSIALLNVIVTVRPLIVVLVIVGEVVSASVNVIGPTATRSLPSSDSTGLAVLGSGSRTCRCRWPACPPGLREADRELDDRGEGRVVDGDRRTDVDRDARAARSGRSGRRRRPWRSSPAC